MFTPDLRIGEEINNQRLMEIFKCANAGGMRRSHETGTLVLICDHTGSTYGDRWVDGILYYTGMGLSGDQTLVGNQNRTLHSIYNNPDDEYNPVPHLFEVNQKGVYTYRGVVEVALQPYPERQMGADGKLRTVWIFPLKVKSDDSQDPNGKGSETTTVQSSTSRYADDNCCYANSLSEFLKETENGWINKMKESFKKNLDLALGDSQVEAWRDCFRVLVNELKEIATCYPGFDIIFEYILPYESGRRPDVLLLSKEQVIILEFKRKDGILTSDLDQVSAYARDIREYHFESRDRTITPVLMLTRTTTLSEEKRDDVYLSCKGRLCRTIKDIIGSDPINQCDLDVWLHSRYEPLPTIVEAARMMMKKEKLPSIRRYSSTCIPDAIGYLIEKTEDAIDKKKHVVAFVTGVPGAGKTFLGLQFVYDIYDTSSKCNSVYLSGNKPLIKVLKRILGNVFVKDLHKVTEEYLRSGATDFKNNIVVFDEGQRAWDKEQMAKRKKTTMSEPDLMIEMCSRRLEWCVLLVLVGEGQEINTGENSGIQQWDEAIKRSEKEWEIICPAKLDSYFKSKKVDEDKRNNLDLSVSLRSHMAENVNRFANLLLNGQIEEASKLTESIYSDQFDMYITRDLDKAKDYVRNRYAGENEKRYGLLASSKAKILPGFGMDNTYETTSLTEFDKWYVAPVTDPKSCCALREVVTEFGCQGLEIDMPIIGWENDMKWVDGKWAKFRPYEPETSDANTFRKNSYRVLLTRGRDGFIIFVPPVGELDDTYEILRKAGIKELIEN